MIYFKLLLIGVVIMFVALGGVFAFAQSTSESVPDAGIIANLLSVVDILHKQINILLTGLGGSRESLISLSLRTVGSPRLTCPVALDTATTSTSTAPGCVPGTPPNAPTNASAVQATFALPSASVIVSWQDNSNNETGFKIERSTNGISFIQIAIVPSNTIFYQNMNVTPGIVYYYRVRAYNAYGNSPYSNVAMVLVAPTTPSNFAATALSSTQVSLTWGDTSSNEAGFKLSRKVGTGGIFPLGPLLPPNTTSYFDGGAFPSTLHTYYLSSFAIASTTGTTTVYAFSPSAVASTTTPGSPPTIPAPPSNLNAIASSSTQVILTWTDNSNNELGFKIERRFGIASTTPFFQIATTTANVIVYPDGGVTASTTYSYRVRAFNVVGNSAYSNTAIVTTP